jgi:nicotinamide phosphoribosyltransferase
MGIGSFTYQNVTRDTHGIAIKATAVGRDWDYDQKGPKEVVAIFKDPKTDNSGKKSARGLLRVDQSVTGEYSLVQDCTWEELHDGCLELVWEDGLFVRTQSFSDVRRVLSEQPTN